MSRYLLQYLVLLITARTDASPVVIIKFLDRRQGDLQGYTFRRRDLECTIHEDYTHGGYAVGYGPWLATRNRLPRFEIFKKAMSTQFDNFPKAASSNFE